MKDRIKKIRKKLDMTQDEFAKSIELKRGSLANIESGINNVSDRNIKLICVTHGVNETWLRTGEGEMFQNDDEFDELVGRLYAENDEFKKKVIKAMLKLQDNEWEIIKKFVESLK